MTHNTVRRLTRTLAGMTLALSGLALAPATAQPTDVVDQHLGVWNYTQPDRNSMTNVAVLEVPAVPVHIPQIGTVTFTREKGGVLGRSDQGCHWHFVPVPGGFDLRDRTQRCFNKVIDSAYTMDTWNIRFDGDRAAETIHATSHQPFGDVGFRLTHGERTRAGIESRAATLSHLTGMWVYDTVNWPRLVNVVNPFTQPKPLSGQVDITPGPGNQVVARTPDNGCGWTLDASGNTAVLSPATQVCRVHGRDITMTFWTIAADGRAQSAIVAGIGPDGTPFQLIVGELTRRTSR